MTTTSATGDVLGLDPATGRILWDVDPWSDARLERLRSEDPGFAAAVGGWVTELAFSPDEDLLAVAGENPEIVLLDPASGREIARWRGSRHGWERGVLRPRRFARDCERRRTVVVWDPMSQRVREEYRFFRGPPTAVNGWEPRFAPSSARTARVSRSRWATWVPQEATVLDLTNGRRLWTRTGDEFVTVPAWSPDSDFVALGGWQDRALILRDASTGRRRLEPVNASAVSC